MAAADGGDVVERLLEQRGELLLAARDGGDPELPRRRPPGRGVDAEHGQAMAVELGLHGRGREVIGNLQLDRPETGGGRRRKPLEQRSFGEKIREVGGEARHGCPDSEVRKLFAAPSDANFGIKGTLATL